MDGKHDGSVRVTMDKRAYERAKEQGRQARRIGQKADRNPYKGGSVRDLAHAWLEGWNQANAERAR